MAILNFNGLFDRSLLTVSTLTAFVRKPRQQIFFSYIFILSSILCITSIVQLFCWTLVGHKKLDSLA